MFEPKTKLDGLQHARGLKTKEFYRLLESRGKKIEYYALTEMRNGKRKNYTIETLMKLCDVLEVSPNEIVEHDAKPLPHKTKRVSADVSKVQDNIDEYGF